MLTPKVGVRLLDEPKIKCDFLTGFRYWHFGQDLQFQSLHPKPEFFRLTELGRSVGGRENRDAAFIEDRGDCFRRCWGAATGVQVGGVLGSAGKV